MKPFCHLDWIRCKYRVKTTCSSDNTSFIIHIAQKRTFFIWQNLYTDKNGDIVITSIKSLFLLTQFMDKNRHQLQNSYRFYDYNNACKVIAKYQKQLIDRKESKNKAKQYPTYTYFEN